MIESGQLTSLLIPSQLPGFVRDNPDYANFVLFLKAYYEWMETTGQVTDGSKNLLTYDDIDSTTEQFLDYYTNDFLPYFPADALVDKKKAIKVARQLYQSKGTPASYEFLFRTLYNSSADIFNTKDAVLKASDGTWYVSRSLRLETLDPNWLNLLSAQGNYKVFGQTSKSVAVIENVLVNGTKTEVYISGVQRLFQSGEFVTVIDSSNQEVLFNGQPLVAKIVGQINLINVDPNNRGLFYSPGDPVVVYGGLSSNTGIGATAEVGTIQSGTILRVNVIEGGYGYQLSPNTIITATNIPGANITVASVSPDPAKDANVALIPADSISISTTTTIGNAHYSFFTSHITANANTSLANAFTFASLTTYPISSVIVNSGSSGIVAVPTIHADSIINTTSTPGLLASLGICAPIQISNGGLGYQVNDVIRLEGGLGQGANAKVTGVYANGAIANVSYVTSNTYPAGGLGYISSGVPTANIISANVSAYGAVLTVPGILGDGAVFSAVTDRAGAIATINVTNNGEDYVTSPNVSLLIEDIVVSNVSISNLAQTGDIVYQGTSFTNATYKGYVDSITLLSPDNNPSQSLYNLRIYNFTTTPSTSLPLKINGKNINMDMYGAAFNSNYNSSGIRYYGDGSAKASATFLNGLATSQGQYLNSQGFPSGFNVLQNDVYNNFTYEITVDKEIAKYREILLNLLHPSGMKALGRYRLSSNSAYNVSSSEAVMQGHTLQFYTGYPASNVSISTDFTNKSSNTIHFGNLAGANIATFLSVSPNTTIEITPTNGPNVKSQVISIDYVANNVVLDDTTWLTFSNVAYVTANAGSNVINITSLTGTYDIVNNGNYSNTSYPLKDIVYAGDQVLVDNNTSRIVQTVDYINNKIYVTSNFTAVSNSLMAVNRTFNTTQVKIYGPLGIQYFPQLIDEAGNNITDEQGNLLLLG